MGMLENKQLLYEDEDDALDWSYLEDYLNILVGMRMVKLADLLYGACEWMSKPNMERLKKINSDYGKAQIGNITAEYMYKAIDALPKNSVCRCNALLSMIKINPDNNQEEHLRTQLNGGVILDAADDLIESLVAQISDLRQEATSIRSQSYKIYQLMWIMMHQEAQFAKQLLNFYERIRGIMDTIDEEEHKCASGKRDYMYVQDYGKYTYSVQAPSEGVTDWYQSQGYREPGDLYKLLLVQIMEASAIAISSDSSDESVGSPPSQVILFGDIPTVIPSTSVVAPETSTIAPVISSAAPVVERTLVASPTGLCGLVPYSDSYFDSPDEMSSSEHISPLPAILPFLFTDSSEAPDSSDGPPSQDQYVIIVARWRSKVALHPSSSSEFPIAPVTASLGTRRRSAILIRPGEAIPFGRPYHTHLYGSRKLLTARKRVGNLPARRLAWRRASPHSSDHHPPSSSSSSDSSPVHSSGLDAPDQAHSGSSTRDVSPRLESSSRDSSKRPLHSSSHSAGPSRKRCRSLVDSVPSSMPVMRSLAPTRADLLPPHKRFRDSYSSEASIEEDTKIDPIETKVDMKLGIGDGDDVRDHVKIDPRDVKDDTEGYEADTSAGDTIEVGIDPMSAPIVEEEIIEPAGEDSSDSSGTRDDIVRSFEDMPIDLDDVMRDFYHHLSEVRIDRIVGIETVQRRLEADQLIARGERAGMIERIESLRLENLKVHAMLDIERDRVNRIRLYMSLSQEEFR
ncbi:hypothetical protein Tco_1575716 [Tanacetum coccineum]